MSIRTERVAGLVKEEISDYLQRQIDASGYGLLTVTDVIMTADLRLAKIYVSHYRSGKTDKAVLEFFEEHSKALRMAVGKAVRLKFTPELRFFIDETLEKVERIERIIAEIHKQSNPQ
jgi:ribosome-binding factor A